MSWPETDIDKGVGELYVIGDKQKRTAALALANMAAESDELDPHTALTEALQMLGVIPSPPPPEGVREWNGRLRRPGRRSSK